MSALPARLRMSADRRRRLVAVAAASEPADLALVGGQVLNVFSGRLEPAAIGIAEGRIAWLEEDAREAREVVDLGGATVVPGLLDCHAHADILCTHDAFAETIARHGTTTACVDTLGLVTNLGDAALGDVLRALERAPAKLIWALRAGRDALSDADAETLPWARLERLLATLPNLSGAGEMVGWPALLAGEERLERFVAATVDAGLRVDGHLPGASRATLATLSAAGLTSDHEAISGPELVRRIELGLWTMIRESSLRRDATALAGALRGSGLPTGRVLLTTDGLTPNDLVAGHLDATVRATIAGGVDPVDAVRMGTLNAATHLGLDAHLGAVAPGRCADLVLVDALETFQPLRVVCDGAFLDAEPPDPASTIAWEAMQSELGRAPLTPDLLEQVCGAGPRLDADGVIVRERVDAESAGADSQLVALVGRDGDALAGATVTGLDAVAAVASTFTGYHDVLLIGRDPRALVASYERVVELGGGMACPGEALALPVWGHLRAGPVASLARDLERFEAAAGVDGGEVPFPFRTLFLSLPALPSICLTGRGVLDGKSGRLLAAAHCF